MEKPSSSQTFDTFAKDYKNIHNAHLPSYAPSDDFLDQKAEFVLNLLHGRAHTNKKQEVLDFGCGPGRLAEKLLAHHTLGLYVGVDESQDSIHQAQSLTKNAIDQKRALFFNQISSVSENQKFDLITAFNVFHHVEPAERLNVAKSLHKHLKPDGLFLLWEHNPFNPVTRYLVKICPFDKGVKLLTRSTARKLFEEAGFKTQKSAYINITPPKIQKLWPVKKIEAAFDQMPLGTQYHVLFTC